MINNPLVGLLMEPFCQSGLKTAKISYFSNKIQLSLNHILSEIFEILCVNKQMFISCGQDETQWSPKKAYFNCVIGIYFLSFFYEHPVFFGSVITFSKIFLTLHKYEVDNLTSSKLVFPIFVNIFINTSFVNIRIHTFKVNIVTLNLFRDT